MKNMTFRFLAFSLLLFAFPFLSGCGPFWVDPYITVTGSPLNWVEIHYYTLSSDPIRRISVYMSESGYVDVKKGTSDLVSNDFAKRYKSAEWHDIRSHRFAVDPDHIREIEQNLVNYGLLDHEKVGKGAHRDEYRRFIAVKANIDTRTYSEQENIFEVDPDLAEQLLDVVREFDNPLMR